MSSTAWIAVAAVISMLSGIAALITAFADLSARPLATWSRRARFVTAVLLLSLAVVLIATTRTRDASDKPLAPASTVTRVEQVADIAPHELSRRRSQSHASVPRPVARVAICLESGPCLGELEAAVDRVLGTRSCRVIGEGEFTVKHEDDLSGIITANLAIRVRVLDMTDGGVLQSFSLLARGGGFDETAARRQAIERMAQMLIDEIAAK